MDKHEHAALLRRALEESTELTRQTLADATGRSYRTVGNWISAKSPTMPSGEERAMLRRLLGPYDSSGDAVERAIRRSELIEWRQDRVLSEYKRNLHEQRGEEAAG
jgi:hypothetical protein